MKAVSPGEFNTAAAKEILAGGIFNEVQRQQGAEAILELVRFLARVAAEREYGLFLARQRAAYDAADQEASS